MTTTNVMCLSETGSSPSLRRYTQRAFQVHLLILLSKVGGAHSMITGKSERKAPRAAVPVVSAVRERLDTVPIVQFPPPQGTFLT